MTLYELYVINDSWNGLENLYIFNGQKMETIIAIDLPDCKFRDCEVLHFKGDMVRIDSIN